jgi:hypothetical protein
VDAYKNIVYPKTYHGAFKEGVKYNRFNLRPEPERQVVFPRARPGKPYKDDSDRNVSNSPKSFHKSGTRLNFPA